MHPLSDAAQAAPLISNRCESSADVASACLDPAAAPFGGGGQSPLSTVTGPLEMLRVDQVCLKECSLLRLSLAQRAARQRFDKTRCSCPVRKAQNLACIKAHIMSCQEENNLNHGQQV